MPNLTTPLKYVHISEQSGHPNRFNVDTDSGAKWTLIPVQSGHRFRGKVDTF